MSTLPAASCAAASPQQQGNMPLAAAVPYPPPPHPTPPLPHFYGGEVGAQTNYDKGTGTSIVNGAHDLRKLGELLEAFIKKYVQCYSCGNPETTIRVKKEFITLKCKACGAVRGRGARRSPAGRTRGGAVRGLGAEGPVQELSGAGGHVRRQL